MLTLRPSCRPLDPSAGRTDTTVAAAGLAERGRERGEVCGQEGCWWLGRCGGGESYRSWGSCHSVQRARGLEEQMGARTRPQMPRRGEREGWGGVFVRALRREHRDRPRPPPCEGPARSELLCGASSGQVGNRGSPGLGSPHRSHTEHLALLTPEGLEEMPRQAQGPVEP